MSKSFEYKYKTSGRTCYYDVDGKLHRLGGPAIVGRYGDKQWYMHGKRHRRSGPALIEGNGTKRWFWMGKEIDEVSHFIKRGA